LSSLFGDSDSFLLVMVHNQHEGLQRRHCAGLQCSSPGEGQSAASGSRRAFWWQIRCRSVIDNGHVRQSLVRYYYNINHFKHFFFLTKIRWFVGNDILEHLKLYFLPLGDIVVACPDINGGRFVSEHKWDPKVQEKV
jgi:hypothetical protein